jgi:hypothetical protein
MVRTIEERLIALEREVELLKKMDGRRSNRDWISAVIGSFADDPEFDEIVRLGRELRGLDRPKDGV